ncbi:MAG TPA: winged helix-turn-helix domain-containing protein [Woeseiaceae bacterium]|nr:winged helix-turn-helix domain-containing protein [Woeseiaceae bacterium]
MALETETRHYYFGEFELDLAARQLLLRGTPVHLERRPFNLLVLLVTNVGQLVSREEVIEQLWPANVIIDFDTGLNTLVRKVRKALGDSSETPQFVETVAGHGYRFIASVAQDKAPAPMTAESPVIRRPRPYFPKYLGAAAVLLLSAVVIGTWYAGQRQPSHTSIAVLPFENLTGSDEFDYLAAGLAEETSLSFSQIDLPNLLVIGVVSTEALTTSVLPLQQVGRENNIDYIVQSSLRQDGRHIRVNSRLIRVNDSAQIWSASFDRELTNVLGLQRELSIAIAEQVRQHLSPDVAAAIDHRQTQNPEAYQLYLKGRYEWTRFSPTSVPRAIQYYQQAVATDPGYALAWAGMAHALITSTVTAATGVESVREASLHALQQALEYGPNLAETQLALGSYYFFLDRNFAAAEEAARRAVQLDPNSAMSYMFLGIVLSTRDNFIEARAMLRRARELDPLFPLMFANSANVSLMAGDTQSALEFATQAIAIDPEFWVGYQHLGNALRETGQLDAALQAYTEAEKLSGGNAQDSIASRAYTLAKLGREDETREILAALVSRSANQYVPPYSFAVIHASLGESDTAFEWLELALQERSGCLARFTSDSRLKSLQSDPRFEPLARRDACMPSQTTLPDTLVPEQDRSLSSTQ